MKLNGVKPRCPVCFDLLDQDKIYTLPCGHAFDHLCILCWLSKSATCPCCRAPADANQLVKVHFDFSTPVERLVGSKASKHASRIQCSWQKWMYERQQKDKRNQRAATTVVVEDTESLKPRAKSRRTGAISRVVNVPLMLVYLAESVLLILAIVASAVAKKSTKLRRNYLSGNLAECLFFNSFLAVFIAIASCATMELENSSARRKYGARNILVYFELLFCA
ncbi:zinc finger protein, partial [Aphelenchoides avenae]